MRVKITLACTECNQRNYDTIKNKKNTPDRIELNKHLFPLKCLTWFPCVRCASCKNGSTC